MAEGSLPPSARAVVARIQQGGNVPERMRHPIILSSAERNQMKNIIDQAQQAKADIRATILFLERQSQLLDTYTEMYKSMLSPIRKLPTELLEMVFKYHCTPFGFQISDGPDEEEVLGSNTLTLAAVCRQWRDHILSTPSLWSCISINFNYIGIYSAESRAKCVKALNDFIDRSGGYLLNLSLRAGHCGFWDANTLAVMQRLLSLTPRWRVVDLDLGEDLFEPVDGTESYLSVDDVSFGNLLHLSFTAEEHLDIQPFFKCPVLCKLSCMPPGDLGRFGPLLPRLQSLKEIEVRTTLEDMSELGHLANKEWESLKLYLSVPHWVSGIYKEGQVSGAPSTSIRTRSLELILFGRMVHYNQIFRSTIFHGVEILHFSKAAVVEGMQNLPSASFNYAFGPSLPFITTLSLKHIAIQHADLSAILRMLPAVQDFTISPSFAKPEIFSQAPFNAAEMMEFFFRSLTIQPFQFTLLLPRLAKLTVEFSGYTLVLRTFLDMLRSRWSPSRTLEQAAEAEDYVLLRSVRFSARNMEVGKAIVESLEGLERRWLRMHVSDKNGVLVDY
jgi:hypothetical protein